MLWNLRVSYPTSHALQKKWAICPKCFIVPESVKVGHMCRITVLRWHIRNSMGLFVKKHLVIIKGKNNVFTKKNSSRSGSGVLRTFSLFSQLQKIIHARTPEAQRRSQTKLTRTLRRPCQCAARGEWTREIWDERRYRQTNSKIDLCAATML